ncbi:MAG: hypothetical protein QXH80_02810 [Candidatus Nanoarchaeia archaeon]
MDIESNILDSDMRNFSCIALAIKTQGNDYDSVLIPCGNQTKVFSLGSSGTTAYSNYTLDESLDSIRTRMNESIQNVMPHLRDSYFKYDKISNMLFFNSKEISLSDIIKKA